jgi:hypothetical protein
MFLYVCSKSCHLLFGCISWNKLPKYEFEFAVREFVGLLKDCQLLEKDFYHPDSNTLVLERKRAIWVSDTKHLTCIPSNHKCSWQRNVHKKSSKLQVNIAFVCHIYASTLTANIVIILLLAGRWPVLSSVQLCHLKLLLYIKAFIGFCQFLQGNSLKYVTSVSTCFWNYPSFLCYMTWSLQCILK